MPPVAAQLSFLPPEPGLALRQVSPWKKGNPTQTEEAQRLKENMRKHYSKPEGWVGRSLIYEVWFDGVFYGHIAGGSATLNVPGLPPLKCPDREQLKHIVLPH